MINNIFIINDTFIKLINKIILNNILVNKKFIINILFRKIFYLRNILMINFIYFKKDLFTIISHNKIELPFSRINRSLETSFFLLRVLLDPKIFASNINF